MKYREVYQILQHRTLHSPAFSYTDRSGWRVKPPTYLQLANPLNIIAVDNTLCYRFWITHSGRDLRISYCKINQKEANTGNTWCIQCKSKGELAVSLANLFNELDAAYSQIQKGA
ncbi:MAG: hypothetical protein IJN67_03765 [Oscillospiraceae bacterium]|nr:hypothetical protein [Oscillospiraceae bacterium]